MRMDATPRSRGFTRNEYGANLEIQTQTDQFSSTLVTKQDNAIAEQFDDLVIKKR